MITRKLIILSMTIALSVSAEAQDLSPCGAVRSSTTLAASCVGPLVVGANNITIDLGGHSVVSDNGEAILMRDRSGVVIKNGGLGGLGAVRIQGGGNNRLRDLFIGSSEGGGPLIVDSPHSELLRINFEVDTDASSIFIGGQGTRVSDSKFRIASDGRREPLLVLGSGAIASKNTFVGSGQGQPSLVLKSSARVEDNTIEWDSTGLAPDVETLAAVEIQGDGAVVESNSIRITGQAAINPTGIIGVKVNGSENFVKGNTIAVSGIGLSSFGIVVSPKSKRNVLQRNRIARVGSVLGAGISVFGSRCTILDNKTDSILVGGSYNIAMRNVANR